MGIAKRSLSPPHGAVDGWNFHEDQQLAESSDEEDARNLDDEVLPGQTDIRGYFSTAMQTDIRGYFSKAMQGVLVLSPSEQPCQSTEEDTQTLNDELLLLPGQKDIRGYFSRAMQMDIRGYFSKAMEGVLVTAMSVREEDTQTLDAELLRLPGQMDIRTCFSTVAPMDVLVACPSTPPRQTKARATSTPTAASTPPALKRPSTAACVSSGDCDPPAKAPRLSGIPNDVVVMTTGLVS
jgi:hypothetical protein|mmetsp:Transcript_1312/g.2282  ORF Transcript_1312/g.2282 Transcript_1312/m.2282 type:complete len:237 (+) Transcript_1312:46-756(+)|eukprot:CAMPEP_0169105736 /NCGR_PEP_ID=MMETSP1015-20121227/23953_1 /TAXON_ID=342587 /ORGANISM="Karlodinium micrum, Strain CCMP2283" /LENGTH=236 /DNA_ID=CAMNT_0009167111 /DNA_START=46 /DNA_END=759 /DNA_ORIENTATION=+